MRGYSVLVAVTLALSLAVMQSVAAGDAITGAMVFANRCKECHEAPPDDRKAGPSLIGLLGRQAGSLPDFAYSDAMRSAGFVWTEQKLREYLLNPKSVVPKNRMPFNGLKREGEVDDLVEYLKSLAEPN